MQRIDQPVSPQALRHGYEPEDVNYKALALVIYFFILSGVLILPAMWVLLKYLEALPAEPDAPLSGIAIQSPHFNDPRLQPSLGHDKMPWEDLKQVHQREDDLFNRMGWRVDPRTGLATIPSSVVAQLSGRPAGPTPMGPYGQPPAELRPPIPAPSPAEGPATPIVGTTQPAAALEGGK